MNFPKRALFFDFHTMPANPDVGKGFAMDTMLSVLPRLVPSK